jgi:hypothetical protein
MRSEHQQQQVPSVMDFLCFGAVVSLMTQKNQQNTSQWSLNAFDAHCKCDVNSVSPFDGFNFHPQMNFSSFCLHFL